MSISNEERIYSDLDLSSLVTIDLVPFCHQIAQKCHHVATVDDPSSQDDSPIVVQRQFERFASLWKSANQVLPILRLTVILGKLLVSFETKLGAVFESQVGTDVFALLGCFVL